LLGLILFGLFLSLQLKFFSLYIYFSMFDLLRLLQNCSEELGAFQRALKSYVASVDAVHAKQHEEFFVGFEGR